MLPNIVLFKFIFPGLKLLLLLVLISYWFQKDLNCIILDPVEREKKAHLWIPNQWDCFPRNLYALKELLSSKTIVFSQLHDSPRSCFHSTNNHRLTATKFILCAFPL